MLDTKFDVIDTCEDIDFDEVSELLKYYGLSDLNSDTQRQVFQNSYVTILAIFNFVVEIYKPPTSK